MNPFTLKEKYTKSKISAQFLAIVIVVIVSISGMLFLGKFGMDTLSSLRAFVGGESIYSKGQQGGAFNLLQYANTGDEKFYDEFLEHMQQPLSDKKARLALDKPDPDLRAATEAFQNGGNHPKDVDGMIDAFLTFRNIDYVDKAIAKWVQADEKVAKLMSLGEEIHRLIRSGETSSGEIEKITARLHLLNHELHGIEEEFSNALGDASRWAKGLFIKIMLGFAMVSAILCMLALWFVGRLVSNMQESSKKLEDRNWLASGLATLNEKMRDEEEITRLMSNVISYVCEHLKAGVGALYVSDDDGSNLKMTAGYAFEKTERAEK